MSLFSLDMEVLMKMFNVQALTSMLEESTTGSNLTRKATLLLAEILHISNRVLPLSFAAKIQVRSLLFATERMYNRIFYRLYRIYSSSHPIIVMESIGLSDRWHCPRLTALTGIERVYGSQLLYNHPRTTGRGILLSSFFFVFG